MDWSITTLLLATLFVSLGALVQAVTGLGGGLVIVPLLAMISIELIPGPITFASLALSTSMAIYGRKEIDFANTKSILVGVLLGTAAAAFYIAKLPLDKLGAVLGIFILLAVALSIKTPKVALDTKGSLTVGALAGFSGTSAGIGAPILALLYQHHSGPSLRATLAFLYFISSIIMLVFLHFAGKFSTAEFISGLFLMPGFILGYFLSPLLAKKFDKKLVRPAVLIISSLSAMVLIYRSVAAMST